jgi:hypothetical protein
MGLALRGCLALVLGATAERRNLLSRVSRGWFLVQDRQNLVVVTMLFMTHNNPAATARRR